MSKIVLWVSDLSAMASFYAALFNVDEPTIGDGFGEVTDGTNSVLLHALPEQYAAQVPLTGQLPVQDEAAIKPVFTVLSIDQAVARIAHTFGTASATSSTYGNFTYRDVIDPEGNVIQLQQAN
jgi:predicted enzyme related to lactoylglutathione lyase